MSSMAIPQDEWNQHKPFLISMYEKYSLKEVKKHMSDTYGFEASVGQYQRVFTKWGLAKYSKRQEIERVLVSAKRQRLDLENAIILGLPSKDQEAFRRALRRYDAPGLQYRFPSELHTDAGSDNQSRDLGSLNGQKIVLLPELNNLPIFQFAARYRFNFAHNTLAEQSLVQYLPTFSQEASSATLRMQSGIHSGRTLIEISYLIYSISNGVFPGTDAMMHFAKLLYDGELNSLLRMIFHSTSPTAVAFSANLLDMLISSRNNVKDLIGYEHLSRLLEVGLKPDSKISDFLPSNLTLLQWALEMERFDLVTILLKAGADINFCGQHGPFEHEQTLRCCENLPIAMLMEASEDIGMWSQTLIEAVLSSKPICCQNLCLITMASNTTALRYFLDRGLNPNPSAKQLQQLRHMAEEGGWILPLQVAVNELNFEAAALLLEAGAHPSGLNFQFKLIRSQPRKDLLSFMGNFTCISPFSIAVSKGDISLIRLLLHHGADMNGCQFDPACRHGGSSLSKHRYCQICIRDWGIPIAVDQLFSGMGAAIEMAQYDSKVPKAMADHHKSLSQVFCEPLDFRSRDRCSRYHIRYGHSPLQIAIAARQNDVMRYLLDHGADIEGCHGLTPLALAIATSEQAAIEALISKGANPIGCCIHGPAICPFAIAAYRDDVVRMEMLLKTGRIARQITSPSTEVCPWQAALQGRAFNAISLLQRLERTSILIWTPGNKAEVIKLAINMADESLAHDILKQWSTALTMHEVQTILCCSIRKGLLIFNQFLIEEGASLTTPEVLDAALDFMQDNQSCDQERFIKALFSDVHGPKPRLIISALQTLSQSRFRGLLGTRMLRNLVEYLDSPSHRLTGADVYGLLEILWCDTKMQYLGIESWRDDLTSLILRRDVYREYRRSESILTPLQAMVKFGRISLVKKLLDLGADVNASSFTEYDTDLKIGRFDLRRMTALQYAIYARNCVLVKMLIQYGADVYDYGAPSYGHAPIQLAACVGSEEIVQVLLENGANVNSAVKSGFGKTALQWAVTTGQPTLVESLLKEGADIEGFIACRSSEFDISRWSADNSADLPAMQLAAYHGNVEIMRLLLRYRANINSTGIKQSEHTPLQWAVKKNRSNLVDMLLAKGADINYPAAPKFGRTALQFAVQECHMSLVELLMRRGANVNSPPAPHGGATALQMAAMKGNLTMCQMLVAAGANVDADPSQKAGRTAIEGAAEHGRLDILMWLLDILLQQYEGRCLDRLQASLDRAQAFAAENNKKYIVDVLTDFKRRLNSRPLNETLQLEADTTTST